MPGRRLRTDLLCREGEEVNILMAKGSGNGRGNSGGKARSAVTGRYVTKGYAKAHPRTTVIETPKRRSGKK